MNIIKRLKIYFLTDQEPIECIFSFMSRIFSRLSYTYHQKNRAYRLILWKKMINFMETFNTLRMWQFGVVVGNASSILQQNRWPIKRFRIYMATGKKIKRQKIQFMQKKGKSVCIINSEYIGRKFKGRNNDTVIK